MIIICKAEKHSGVLFSQIKTFQPPKVVVYVKFELYGSIILYSPLYVKMSPTPENSDAHMVNDTHPDLASSSHFDSALAKTQLHNTSPEPNGH